MAGMEEQLAALATMSPAQLADSWVSVTGSVVPNISANMLRLALGYELQAKVHGGLSRSTQQKLGQLARAKTVTSAAQAGMRLVRVWDGVAHVVVVGEDGVIRWNERHWRSLSEVARAITGTRWSGPAFFGLKKKVAA